MLRACDPSALNDIDQAVPPGRCVRRRSLALGDLNVEDPLVARLVRETVDVVIEQLPRPTWLPSDLEALTWTDIDTWSSSRCNRHPPNGHERIVRRPALISPRVSSLLPAAVGIYRVPVSHSILTARSFAERHGDRVDADQMALHVLGQGAESEPRDGAVEPSRRCRGFYRPPGSDQASASGRLSAHPPRHFRRHVR